MNYAKPMQALRRISYLEWLCLACGIVMTLRYRWLLDDAFVYYRYLDNLLFLDIGLVYNHGEYVEGFSSPGWLLVLLPFRALHIDYWLLTQVLGCVAFALFWWLLCLLNRELSPPASESAPGRTLNLPLVYLASNYAVTTYFTSGLETPLVQLFGIVYALYVSNPDSKTRQVAIALSPLIRQEFALPLLIVLLWSWWRRGHFPLRTVILTTLFCGSWGLFRIIYYADLLPNTFYLKNTVGLSQGWVYLRETLTTYHFYPFAILALAALLLLRTRVPRPADLQFEKRGVMLLVAASIAAYVVSIGGDPRHYRYLAFPFCLAACAFAGVPEWLTFQFASRAQKVLQPVGLGLLIVFGLAYPAQLNRHPFTHQEKHKQIQQINDASNHRKMPSLQHRRWIQHANIEAMLAYRAAHPRFEYVDAVSEWWCVFAYQRFDRRTVQSLGLTDAFLARTPMPSDRPAHKWGLYPLSIDIVRMYELGFESGRGMFRRYIASRGAASRGDDSKGANSGKAPAWMRKNLASIEQIEKKVFNRHGLIENIGLAFSFPDPIVADQSPRNMQRPNRLRRAREAGLAR